MGYKSLDEAVASWSKAVRSVESKTGSNESLSSSAEGVPTDHLPERLINDLPSDTTQVSPVSGSRETLSEKSPGDGIENDIVGNSTTNITENTSVSNKDFGANNTIVTTDRAEANTLKR